DPIADVRGRAMAFSLLALSPLFQAFSCRSARASLFTLRPIIPVALFGAVAISAVTHLVAVLVPWLRPVFRTYPLSASEWVILIALSASIVPALEVWKLTLRLVGD
ncbi:MAG: cation transporting ATPase C-terminal domain-containing protein, partial [Polyangiaceae bacterium]